MSLSGKLDHNFSCHNHIMQRAFCFSAGGIEAQSDEDSHADCPGCIAERIEKLRRERETKRVSRPKPLSTVHFVMNDTNVPLRRPVSSESSSPKSTFVKKGSIKDIPSVDNASMKNKHLKNIDPVPNTAENNKVQPETRNDKEIECKSQSSYVMPSASHMSVQIVPTHETNGDIEIESHASFSQTRPENFETRQEEEGEYEEEYTIISKPRVPEQISTKTNEIIVGTTGSGEQTSRTSMSSVTSGTSRSKDLTSVSSKKAENSTRSRRSLIEKLGSKKQLSVAPDSESLAHELASRKTGKSSSSRRSLMEKLGSKKQLSIAPDSESTALESVSRKTEKSSSSRESLSEKLGSRKSLNLDAQSEGAFSSRRSLMQKLGSKKQVIATMETETVDEQSTSASKLEKTSSRRSLIGKQESTIQSAGAVVHKSVLDKTMSPRKGRLEPILSVGTATSEESEKSHENENVPTLSNSINKSERSGIKRLVSLKQVSSRSSAVMEGSVKGEESKRDLNEGSQNIAASATMETKTSSNRSTTNLSSILKNGSGRTSSKMSVTSNRSTPSTDRRMESSTSTTEESAKSSSALMMTPTKTDSTMSMEDETERAAAGSKNAFSTSSNGNNTKSTISTKDEDIIDNDNLKPIPLNRRTSSRSTCFSNGSSIESHDTDLKKDAKTRGFQILPSIPFNLREDELLNFDDEEPDNSTYEESQTSVIERQTSAMLLQSRVVQSEPIIKSSFRTPKTVSKVTNGETIMRKGISKVTSGETTVRMNTTNNNRKNVTRKNGINMVKKGKGLLKWNR